MSENLSLDLGKLSDRALIALQAGLDTLWAIEATERKNAFYPRYCGETTSSDLDLVDTISEELYGRGTGAHRFCHDHLLPLVAPDGCERCAGIEAEVTA